MIYINFYLFGKDINNIWEYVLIEIFIFGVKCVICFINKVLRKN